ncbi:hypothetical protein IGI04_029840, partial [Brassica rapa subsp. trilocularis]
MVGKKIQKNITKVRCRSWKGSGKVSYQDISTLESHFDKLFPFISHTGNNEVVDNAKFITEDEKKDEESGCKRTSKSVLTKSIMRWLNSRKRCLKLRVLHIQREKPKHLRVRVLHIQRENTKRNHHRVRVLQQQREKAKARQLRVCLLP